MPKTPDQVAEKWQRNLSNAAQSIRDGVAGVTEAPTAKAARRVDAYQAGVMRAVADGSWVNGLNRVGLQDWKNAMNDKGIARITAGVQTAKPKVAAFMAQFLPFVQSNVEQLNATLPRGDFTQNMARMNRMAELNHQFRRNR